MPFHIPEVSRTIAELGFLAALLFNSVLIYLTGWHTDNITGTYKYMIIFSALLGLSFSCTEMISRPFVHNYNGAFIYFSLAKEISEWKSAVVFLLAVYAGTYAALISSVAVLFIYRYFVLLNSEWLRHLFVGWKMIIWLFYIAIFGFAWAALVYYCAYPDPISKNYIQEEIQTVYKMDINDTAVFIVLAYDQNPNPGAPDDYKLRWSSVIFILGTMSILLTQYVVMSICGTSMHIQMNEKLKNFSVTHQRLHKQFFKTLVIQITVPTILFHMPIFPVLLTPFLNLELSFQSGIIYSLFSLYPPIDGLIIMCVVSEYRNALSKLIGRPVAGSSVSVITRTQQETVEQFI